MAEEPQYGAFGDVLTLNDGEDVPPADDFTYGVYQIATQKPDLEQGQLQKIYGTGAMPIFEWAKTIQTGTRTYDPANPDDQRRLRDYEEFVRRGGLPEGYLTPDQIAKQAMIDTATAVGTNIASNIGASVADPFLKASGMDFTDRALRGVKSSLYLDDIPSDVIQGVGGLSAEQANKIATQGLVYQPELESFEAAKASGRLVEFNLIDDGSVIKDGTRINIGTVKEPKFAYKANPKSPQQIKGLDYTTQGGSQIINTPTSVDGVADPIAKRQGIGTSTAQAGKAIAGSDTGYLARVKGRASPTLPDGSLSPTASAGIYAAAFDFGASLLQGKDLEDSAKSAADAGIGSYIGFTLGGPVGATIGSFVSKSIFKRVICNELMRQGTMSKKQVILDYKFTKEYLSEQHVNGYHLWAVWVVEQMRKGKYVKLWSHIARHRANEIEYIYKYRDKPDYLGKIYRKILEPTCWFLGLFKKKTDWEILYKERKI